MSEEMIYIAVSEYEKLKQEIKILQERELELIALESAGVDNWQGYDYAMDILEELKKDSNDEDTVKES